MDQLGWYCADQSTSMKFGTYVDQNILNSFLRAPNPEVTGGRHNGNNKYGHQSLFYFFTTL